MVSFFDTCRVLYMRIMQAIALGMGMDEHFFDPFVDNGDNNLRLLHYPPVGKDVFGNPAQVRAGEHSDYGSITLLFQDRRGGLQVRRPDGDGDGEGGFVDVVPVEGTVVVNAGDLLARWSNDTIRSTRHRVVEPPSPDDGEETTYPARYSVAYFCNPNLDSWIEALPGTYETVRKYEGIKTEEYLVRRLTATI